ncbi:sel1 repeat family protein [Stenotrophomonas sp. GD03908]|uniref:Tetratricopeptide repeat protein n=2 Tax=Lysobacteraceae TaxID=32033 RepID=A0AAJ2TJK9_STEMA|nr:MULTISPECIES: tetratricopeptide repeat protein [Stenotrophomonas]MBH1481023.1 sel1 repeat family protein [Stenotrophomonas maltophilia]MDH0978227.1 sel1 repeat family protein [Stenotrophomonas sp. GD03908]MDQ7292946.1 tetratricopeptide repeat protein [Stenotrophomonas sp. Sm0041]MDZ5763505.1 tetratricopeptide repeat protein [Stenotrophomonas maltophilia]
MKKFMEDSIGARVRTVLCTGLFVFACSAHALGNDEAASLKSVLAAAETGSADAENDLGDRYNQGNGVVRNPVTAVEWYRKAAEQGHASAQSSLAVMYLNGTGVPKDLAQALFWVRKAAEQGNGLAQSDLGMMYLEGLGVSKDDAQGLFWIRRSAEGGASAGQYNLGSLYERGGAGLTKDRAEAMRWYTKAAVQDLKGILVSDARQKLCSSGKEGQVWCDQIEPPPRFNSVEELMAAAKSGDAEVQAVLATMYADGIGVPKDDIQSAAWFRKAAMAGYAPAQFELGNLYASGQGVPKDRDEQIYWYCEAVAQGHDGAFTNLQIMSALELFDPKDCPERRARRR